jgi:hypothetical protein
MAVLATGCIFSAKAPGIIALKLNQIPALNATEGSRRRRQAPGEYGNFLRDGTIGLTVKGTM